MGTSGNLLQLPEELLLVLPDELLNKMLELSELSLNYLSDVYNFYKIEFCSNSDAYLESQCMQFIVRYILKFDEKFKDKDVKTILKLEDDEIQILRSKYGIINDKECECVPNYKMHNIINKLGRWILKDINPKLKQFLFFKSHKGEQSITVLKPYLDERFINALIKDGFNTIQKLLSLTTVDVCHINGIGLKDCRKIIDAVHSYGTATSLICRFRDEQFGINNTSDGEITVNHTLNYLGLSLELCSILTDYIMNKKTIVMHGNIKETSKILVTLNDLICLTTNEVISIPKIGMPRFKVIANKIHSLGFLFADESLNLTDEIIFTNDILDGKESILTSSNLNNLFKIRIRKNYRSKNQTDYLVGEQDYLFSKVDEFNYKFYPFDCEIVHLPKHK